MLCVKSAIAVIRHSYQKHEWLNSRTLEEAGVDAVTGMVAAPTSCCGSRLLPRQRQQSRKCRSRGP
jgi:hypothetical protein